MTVNSKWHSGLLGAVALGVVFTAGPASAAKGRMQFSGAPAFDHSEFGGEFKVCVYHKDGVPDGDERGVTLTLTAHDDVSDLKTLARPSNWKCCARANGETGEVGAGACAGSAKMWHKSGSKITPDELVVECWGLNDGGGGKHCIYVTLKKSAKKSSETLWYRAYNGSEDDWRFEPSSASKKDQQGQPVRSKEWFAPKPKCADTCHNGCCSSTYGTCYKGTSDSKCGSGGEFCDQCTGADVCTSGACKAPKPKPCSQTCAGCCVGGSCKSGTSTDQCGTGGQTCQSCGSGWSCTSGTCTAPKPKPCSQTCAGCCVGGSCKSGTSTDQCGTGGQTCQSCGSGWSCTSNTCTASKPKPKTCKQRGFDKWPTYLLKAAFNGYCGPNRLARFNCIDAADGTDCSALDLINPFSELCAKPTDCNASGRRCTGPTGVLGALSTAKAMCVVPECTTAPDCDDNEPCTTHDCSASTFTCVKTLVSGGCNDGDPCTEGDTCALGECEPGTTKCKDGKVCTIDTCHPLTGACSYPPIPGCCTAAGACDDGKPCTQNKCVANKCVYPGIKGCCADDVDCDKGDYCGKKKGKLTYCVAHTCESRGLKPWPSHWVKGALNGVCSADRLARNQCLRASDKQPCTLTDIANPFSEICKKIVDCKGSGGRRCTGPTGLKGWVSLAKAACIVPKCLTKDDCDDDEFCTDETCNQDEFICNYKKLSGKACEDGDLCTKGDACFKGACKTGVPKCSDGKPCTVDTCHPATGGCTNELSLEGCWTAKTAAACLSPAQGETLATTRRICAPTSAGCGKIQDVACAGGQACLGGACLERDTEFCTAWLKAGHKTCPEGTGPCEKVYHADGKCADGYKCMVKATIGDVCCPKGTHPDAQGACVTLTCTQKGLLDGKCSFSDAQCSADKTAVLTCEGGCLVTSTCKGANKCVADPTVGTTCAVPNVCGPGGVACGAVGASMCGSNADGKADALLLRCVANAGTKEGCWQTEEACACSADAPTIPAHCFDRDDPLGWLDGISDRLPGDKDERISLKDASTIYRLDWDFVELSDDQLGTGGFLMLNMAADEDWWGPQLKQDTIRWRVYELVCAVNAKGEAVCKGAPKLKMKAKGCYGGPLSRPWGDKLCVQTLYAPKLPAVYAITACSMWEDDGKTVGPLCQLKIVHTGYPGDATANTTAVSASDATPGAEFDRVQTLAPGGRAYFSLGGLMSNGAGGDDPITLTCAPDAGVDVRVIVHATLVSLPPWMAAAYKSVKAFQAKIFGDAFLPLLNSWYIDPSRRAPLQTAAGAVKPGNAALKYQLGAFDCAGSSTTLPSTRSLKEALDLCALGKPTSNLAFCPCKLLDCVVSYQVEIVAAPALPQKHVKARLTIDVPGDAGTLATQDLWSLRVFQADTTFLGYTGEACLPGGAGDICRLTGLGVYIPGVALPSDMKFVRESAELALTPEFVLVSDNKPAPDVGTRFLALGSAVFVAATIQVPGTKQLTSKLVGKYTMKFVRIVLTPKAWGQVTKLGLKTAKSLAQARAWTGALMRELGAATLRGLDVTLATGSAPGAAAKLFAKRLKASLAGGQFSVVHPGDLHVPVIGERAIDAARAREKALAKMNTDAPGIGPFLDDHIRALHAAEKKKAAQLFAGEVPPEGVVAAGAGNRGSIDIARGARKVAEDPSLQQLPAKAGAQKTVAQVAKEAAPGLETADEAVQSVMQMLLYKFVLGPGEKIVGLSVKVAGQAERHVSKLTIATIGDSPALRLLYQADNGKWYKLQPKGHWADVIGKKTIKGDIDTLFFVRSTDKARPVRQVSAEIKSGSAGKSVADQAKSAKDQVIGKYLPALKQNKEAMQNALAKADPTLSSTIGIYDQHLMFGKMGEHVLAPRGVHSMVNAGSLGELTVMVEASHGQVVKHMKFTQDTLGDGLAAAPLIWAGSSLSRVPDAPCTTHWQGAFALGDGVAEVADVTLAGSGVASKKVAWSYHTESVGKFSVKYLDIDVWATAASHAPTEAVLAIEPTSGQTHSLALTVPGCLQTVVTDKPEERSSASADAGRAGAAADASNDAGAIVAPGRGGRSYQPKEVTPARAKSKDGCSASGPASASRLGGLWLVLLALMVLRCRRAGARVKR